MCPLAFCSVTAPCTDLRDSCPLPPRTLTSPFTVSAVTPACAPSTSMSVETPCKFISIQVGALIWYSTICARPRRLSAFTLTVELPTPTSMRSRLECVACTRTAFWFQARTTISPPKLSTSSRMPGRTGTVVSVCWVTTSVMTAATFKSTMSFSLSPGRHERVGAPQQLQLAPHGVGEVLIQIGAAGIGRERPSRLHDRGVDRHQALGEHAHGSAVEPAAVAPLLQGALQLGDGGVVAGTRLLHPPDSGSHRLHAGLAPHQRAVVLRRAVQRQVGAPRAEQQQHGGSRRELRHGERNAAAGAVRRETHYALRARRHTDLLRDSGPQVGRRRPVIERLRARHHSAQLVQRGLARRAAGEMSLERASLGRSQITVEVAGQPISPLVLHDASTLIDRDASSMPSVRDAAAISTSRARCRACPRSPRACSLPCRAARTPRARRRGAGRSPPGNRATARSRRRGSAPRPARPPRRDTARAPCRATYGAPGSH